MEHIIIGVDPSLSEKTSSDTTGIVIAGRVESADGYHYIIMHASEHRGVTDWSVSAIALFHKFDTEYGRVPVHMYIERNAGGDMNMDVITSRDPKLKPYVKLEFVTKSKEQRAQLSMALYENSRIAWMEPFPKLANELHSFNPSMPGQKSPNLLDAHTLAINNLYRNMPTKFRSGKAGLGGGIVWD